jgi:hypothetical protein
VRPEPFAVTIATPLARTFSAHSSTIRSAVT